MTRRTLVSVLALVLVAACASGGGRGANAGARITVTVENNLQPPTSVTVSVVEQLGARRLLGDVGPMDTRSFSFNPATTSGTYRLTARTTAGAELVSDPLTVFGGETIRWDLFGNAVVR